MLAIIVVAVFLDGGVSGDAGVFAGAFAAMFALLGGLYLHVEWRSTSAPVVGLCRYYVVGSWIGAAGWAISIAAPAPARYWLWGVTVVLNDGEPPISLAFALAGVLAGFVGRLRRCRSPGRRGRPRRQGCNGLDGSARCGPAVVTDRCRSRHGRSVGRTRRPRVAPARPLCTATGEDFRWPPAKTRTWPLTPRGHTVRCRRWTGGTWRSDTCTLQVTR